VRTGADPLTDYPSVPRIVMPIRELESLCYNSNYTPQSSSIQQSSQHSSPLMNALSASPIDSGYGSTSPRPYSIPSPTVESKKSSRLKSLFKRKKKSKQGSQDSVLEIDDLRNSPPTRLAPLPPLPSLGFTSRQSNTEAVIQQPAST